MLLYVLLQDLIEAEIKACSDQLLEGLSYYKEPRLGNIFHTSSDSHDINAVHALMFWYVFLFSPASETELKKSSEVKGKTLDFVLAISKHLVSPLIVLHKLLTV